jgi:formate/nitrite transporter FocA (FNT family)
MLSILAGMMIALGAIIYLSAGGPVGAIMFSMGLLTILTFGFNLFTGKAGLIATKEFGMKQLLGVWIGNFIGTFIVAVLLFYTPNGILLAEKASQIVSVRNNNNFATNIIYGIFCGILMYMAVTTFKKTNGNPIYAIMPVAMFILSGFNHCVADMFYIHLGSDNFNDYLTLIPTTIGNFIGCNTIPASILIKERVER